MEHHLVLRVIAKIIIPLILVFALYVQFHGDYGPGGGFQAGVIFASAFILYGLLYGIKNVRKAVSPNVVRITAALGVLIYIGVGITSMVFGGNFLDYGVFADSSVTGQHIGILVIEFGVGLTVASIMITMFYVFAHP